jgi:hypothetical protein
LPRSECPSGDYDLADHSPDAAAGEDSSADMDMSELHRSKQEIVKEVEKYGGLHAVDEIENPASQKKEGEERGGEEGEGGGGAEGEGRESTTSREGAAAGVVKETDGVKHDLMKPRPVPEQHLRNTKQTGNKKSKSKEKSSKKENK